MLRCAALVAEAEDDASAHSANLARLRASASATVGEVEDARVTHELKTRELDVARLKLRKLRADLESQNASEAYALAELELSNARCVAATREVQAELERIQLYVAVVRSSPLALMDPERRHFFYCDCHVGGLGRWFAECFSERPNWHPYPAQRWFLAPPAPGDDPAGAAGPPAAPRLAAVAVPFPATPCLAWNSAILTLHSFKTRSMAPARQLHTSMKSSRGIWNPSFFSARELSVCQLYTFGDIALAPL